MNPAPTSLAAPVTPPRRPLRVRWRWIRAYAVVGTFLFSRVVGAAWERVAAAARAAGRDARAARRLTAAEGRALADWLATHPAAAHIVDVERWTLDAVSGGALPGVARIGTRAPNVADLGADAVAAYLLDRVRTPAATAADCVDALHHLWRTEADGEPWGELQEALLAAVRRVCDRQPMDELLNRIADPLALRAGPPGLRLTDLRSAEFLPPADQAGRERAALAVADYTATWLDRTLGPVGDGAVP